MQGRAHRVLLAPQRHSDSAAGPAAATGQVARQAHDRDAARAHTGPHRSTHARAPALRMSDSMHCRCDQPWSPATSGRNVAVRLHCRGARTPRHAHTMSSERTPVAALGCSRPGMVRRPQGAACQRMPAQQQSRCPAHAQPSTRAQPNTRARASANAHLQDRVCELDDEPMPPHFPVAPAVRRLEAAQQRHGAGQLLHLAQLHGREARVAQRAVCASVWRSVCGARSAGRSTGL
jgi:hypothetical protein